MPDPLRCHLTGPHAPSRPLCSTAQLLKGHSPLWTSVNRLVSVAHQGHKTCLLRIRMSKMPLCNRSGRPVPPHPAPHPRAHGDCSPSSGHCQQLSSRGHSMPGAELRVRFRLARGFRLTHNPKCSQVLRPAPGAFAPAPSSPAPAAGAQGSPPRPPSPARSPRAPRRQLRTSGRRARGLTWARLCQWQRT